MRTPDDVNYLILNELITKSKAIKDRAGVKLIDLSIAATTGKFKDYAKSLSNHKTLCIWEVGNEPKDLTAENMYGVEWTNLTFIAYMIACKTADPDYNQEKCWECTGAIIRTFQDYSINTLLVSRPPGGVITEPINFTKMKHMQTVPGFPVIGDNSSYMCAIEFQGKLYKTYQ